MTTVVEALTTAVENSHADETFEFGQTGFSRHLTTGTLVATASEGGGTSHTVQHTVTFTYDRVESTGGNPPDMSSQDDAPAMTPYKQYRITIEEV